VKRPAWRSACRCDAVVQGGKGVRSAIAMREKQKGEGIEGE